MKLFRKITLIALFLIGLVGLSNKAIAQCKSYTKKYCLPSLNPYIHNGQLTSAVLNPGDGADIEMTFNAGKEYRILVCNQEQIGNVQFKILDQSRNVLHESDPEETNPSWDFKVENTQQLIVQLKVPKMEKSNQRISLVPNGCVAILVGFKK
jgi:hypothetical protein